MKRIALVIVALIAFVCASAQNVTISGTTSQPNALVRLFVYDDLFARECTKRAETRADADGRFSLSAPIKGIVEAQIAIDLERVDMIISEKSSYNIEITLNENNENVSYFDRGKPEIKIHSATDSHLQENLFVTDNIINGFVYDYFSLMMRHKRYDLLDSLSADIDSALDGYSSVWLDNHIRYRKASLLLALHSDGGRRVIRDYFDGNDVLYDCAAYADLFAEVFENYFHSRQFDITDFRRAYYGGYDAFMQYLKTDKLISSNPQLGELVIIWNMFQLYYEVPDDHQLILEYFATLKKKTAYPEHKIIIDDIIKQINKLATNSEAPVFSLKNSAGKIVSLGDYRNNVVVLQFVGDFSPLIMNDFYSLREIAGVWGNKVKIITIAPTKDMQLYADMFRREGITWDLLDIGNNILLLEDYNVPTYPAYVVIKQGGKIGMTPAPAPDQGLDRHVARFISRD